MSLTQSSPARTNHWLVLVFFVSILSHFGCAAQPDQAWVMDPNYRQDLQASVAVPMGWEAQPVDRGSNYVTQVWISPSGDTALGVICFSLPLPVGHEWALWGFLQNMKKSEGQAQLVDKQWDESSRALRFIAQGGRYRVRSKLMVDRLQGWSVFAGTLAGRRVNQDELDIAERAREAVRVQRSE